MADGMRAPLLALVPGQRIAFGYRNWRGLVSERRVEVRGVEWGATSWHPAPGWLLRAWDLDKGEERLFAMADMRDVQPLVEEEPDYEAADIDAVARALYFEDGVGTDRLWEMTHPSVVATYRQCAVRALSAIAARYPAAPQPVGRLRGMSVAAVATSLGSGDG